MCCILKLYTFISGPFSIWLCDRYTHQKVIFVGGLFASTGLILSSFAPSIEVMYITYGILTGILMFTHISPFHTELSMIFSPQNIYLNLGYVPRIK